MTTPALLLVLGLVELERRLAGIRVGKVDGRLAARPPCRACTLRASSRLAARLAARPPCRACTLRGLFRKQSTTLRSAMWWKSVKTMLIMSCFVFVLGIVCESRKNTLPNPLV